MIRQLKQYRLQVLGITSALAVVALSLGTALGAGTASLSLSPNAGSYVVGSTFTVTVYEDGGSQPVAAAGVDVKYNPAKLSLVAANNGSTFGLCVAPTQSSDTVSFGCTMTGNATVTGRQAVGTVTFKVLTSGGSTPVTFGTSSAIIRDSDNQNIWNNNTAGGNYTLTAPVVTPPSTPTTPTTPSTPNKTTQAQTSTPSTTTSGKAKTSTSKSGGVVASGPAAQPNIAVQQADPAAPVAVDDSAVIAAPGSDNYLVAIRVFDKKGKPLKGAKVVLNGKTAIVDDKGVASFASVPEGSYQAKITVGDKTTTKPVEVSEATKSNGINQVDVTLAAQKGSVAPVAAGGGVTFIVLLLVAMFLLRHRLLPRKLVHQRFEAMPQILLQSKPASAITPVVHQTQPAAAQAPTPPVPARQDLPRVMPTEPGQVITPTSKPPGNNPQDPTNT